MALTRYYIRPGLFNSLEELMNTPGTPDETPSMWNRYSNGQCYISIWDSEEGLVWGYFDVKSLHWAIERGYQPFVVETEEVLI